jgi:hypothetical protein
VIQKREIPYSGEECATLWTWIYRESSKSVHDGDPKTLARPPVDAHAYVLYVRASEQSSSC